jgi:hypothetical protein
MRVTVLWEDQRGGQLKGFGPGELLVSCVADELEADRAWISKHVSSHPKKGNGNVRRALREDLGLLIKHGPVIAVIDRDKVSELLSKLPLEPLDCNGALVKQFRAETAGNYQLVLLVENVETLVDAVVGALGGARPTTKPTPDERDRVLVRAAWSPNRSLRDDIRGACQSFDRVVKKVANACRAHRIFQ